MTRVGPHPVGSDLASRSRFAFLVGLPLAARRIAPLLVLLTLFVLQISPLSAAKVKVSGFGLFGNAELKGALQLLEIDDGPIDGRKIDDGAFLILTRLTQNGYLRASLSGDWETPDGEQSSTNWSTPFEPTLDENVVAEKIHYTVVPGTLFYYNEVSIEGLKSIELEEALTYIIPNTTLISSKKDRAYSESILSNHQKQLTAGLAALGRIDAKVTASSVEINEETGAVDVKLLAEEGPLYKITKAEIRRIKGDKTETSDLEVGDTIYTRNWVEDQIRILRNESYHLGYPDTKVTSKIIKAAPEGDTVSIHIGFDIKPGPKIILSKIEHKGATDTHRPMLNRKADLKTNEPLDITKTEAARRRLSRIGIFNRIDLSYEPDGEGQRKAIYTYKNSERIKAQLLLGYGSYEQFRAGLLARRENLFGRAHTLSFSAIQSIKSRTGNLGYTVQELIGESIAGSMELDYLDRQELTFDREERGVSLGLFTRMSKLNLDIGLDYSFDQKKTSDSVLSKDLDNIGSLSLRAAHSKLNNILYPTSGYNISGAFRVASDEFGGQANFIRPEFSGSYHHQFGERWVFHIGTKGGVFRNEGTTTEDLLKAEGFLIGGENSLRGYRRMQAGPLDENGKPLPAEAFTQINVEFEYPILEQLNVVFFVDAARTWESSRDLNNYEDLSSAGLGFRYNTIVGPVRLEYGHNLDPRPEDPTGTVHLSIGFPF